MTGLPNFNEPSFNNGAALLREVGWFVYNPVENDAEAGIVLEGTEGTEDFDLSEAMKRDLVQVCDVDCVFVLPGWQESTGGSMEIFTAQKLGKPVYSLLSGRDITDEAYAIAEEAHMEEQQMKQINTMLEALPVDSAARKDIPITTGVIDYFPAALAAVAGVSKAGNDKHNPGQPLHWSRGKSSDQADAIGRHLIERGGIDPDTGMRHSAQLAWRALALLQLELEEAGEAPMARGASE